VEQQRVRGQLITFKSNKKPIKEVIEWTDDYGVVVATGSTVSITPVTPGIQNYGATSLINGCRSNDIKVLNSSK
jgi:hypothetical protein